MDFNDLNSRLKRLNLVLDKSYELDIKPQINVSRKVSGDIHEIGFSFGTMEETEMIERIFNVINNIASLKDHLKNKLESLGKDPKLVEDMINGSKELCLILDLWNQDKHGYPLKKTNRSNLNPQIVNVSQGLVISNLSDKASVSFTITENAASYTSSENAAIAISGEVVDGSGKFIISVENMFRQSVVDLENFLKVHGLL
jgi:hypothetical protein